MALLDNTQVIAVFAQGGPRKWQLFEVRNVSATDSVDLAAMGYFSVVRKAVLLGCTTDTVLDPPTALGPAGLEFPAGLNEDSVYMLVDGVPFTS